MVTEDRELVEGKEYEVIQPRIGLLSPKDKRTHTIGVILKGKKEDFPGNRLFYGLSVKYDTDSEITKLSKKLLSDYLSEEDISHLTNKSFYVYGLLLP